MTLTIELPDTLTQQLQDRQVSKSEVQAVALAALEIWLSQPVSQHNGRFAESAVPFVQRVISQNRELFETLAKR